ncbi:aconitate hydratase AcnA [Candidatus Berkiella cookevillensis]|uniref:Aconitate hydratase n=1 Tax=Candidatus Berkiella cookevillensis TaxID=437022 RepID=A0A0Q9YRQ3_9GAMM|nr:aconitate hydratase AcnA [Candidatus Berkiella cookevillensis]MCS5708869.1 aconitate hydratase AcnA [Candidatus Berkiella cookevillensis]
MKSRFNTQKAISINNKSYHYYDLKALPESYNIDRLPFSIKILLENLLRFMDGVNITDKDVEAVLHWDPKAVPDQEIAFTPSRVILQDFTGVPAVVDLAAMRVAMKKLGGNPNKINPLAPVELVIDHSVMVDHFGNNKAFNQNTELEYERNFERYAFLRWGQNAFKNFKVVPPGTGIVHQVNLEYLARVVFENNTNGTSYLYPDTLVGTDSHTTMINGLGVLGWGVGGIEAEAAMLGQPITMLIPQVVGFKITGKLPEGATATDLVLIITQMLRQKGVVGKFVEFYGDGLDNLPLADRATIANMAPEYGATCGIFPIDDETLNFLKLTGRPQEQIDIIEHYTKAQGLFRVKNQKEAEYSDVLSLNLSEVVPSIAGPKRPQDRIPLTQSKEAFKETICQQLAERQDKVSDDMAINEGANIIEGEVPIVLNDQHHMLRHGDVVIAAITSCTNTSNPAVMLAAGLIAKKAIEKGIHSKPWVKTSLAPGSQVVTDYLEKSKLTTYLDQLGFNLVGYGCTTCIGNSGPLLPEVEQAIQKGNLQVSAVLSGNRNFEGRIHPQVRNAYLASPPLVVIYALAGTMNIDLYKDPISKDKNGNPIFLKDIWPSHEEIQAEIKKSVSPELFRARYAAVYDGDQHWKNINVTESELYQWEENSTYVKHPPYFEDMSLEVPKIENLNNARVLVKVADSVTTDHISPAGSISSKSPAGQYLLERNIPVSDFNSYGSRRGNHEVMMRGTFANIRLRNQMAPGTEGGWTTHQTSGEVMSLYDASLRYAKENVPLIILAGKEYGTGSSRDWAAKGTRLLGVRVVIAESYERIHRSNLIGMGVLPLEYKAGENADQLKLTGQETYSVKLDDLKPQGDVTVEVEHNGNKRSFKATVRIDTPKELSYFKHGGILHYVLRELAKNGK